MKHRCLICATEDVIPGREYSWCPNCHTVRSIHRYDASIYDEKYAAHYAELTGTEISIRLMRYRVTTLKKFVPGWSNVVDVGCGTGDFVRACGEALYKCLGVEPNRKAAEVATHTANGHVIANQRDGLKPDAFTLFDVFEHFESPRQELFELWYHLKPGGHIIMVTPNVDAVPYGDHEALRAWKHAKFREHLWLHSLEGLTILAEQMGMEVVHHDYGESDIRPGNPNRDLLTVVMRRPA